MAERSERIGSSWSRRVFTQKALRGWLGLVLAPAFYAVARRLGEKAVYKPLRDEDVGPMSDFTIGASKEILIRGQKIMIVRLAVAQFVAVEPICSHQGCSVRFDKGRAGLEPGFACNCHDSRFGSDGTKLTGPAPYPLKRYYVAVTEGRLIISEGLKSPVDAGM